jgi:DNA-directed RNA polymerase specialized sigma24 family protein
MAQHPAPVLSAADGLDALLARACEGDPRAATELHDRYCGLVLTYVRAGLKAFPPNLESRLRPRLDHEDVAQEVWAVLFSLSLGASLRFPNEAAFRGYLKRMVTNRLRDARQ